MTLSDVRPAKDFEATKPSSHATIRTFDGLVADLDGWTQDGKHFVAVKTTYDEALAKRFHVESKPAEKPAEGKAAESAPAAATKPATDNVAEAAKTTNDQLQGWVFEVPDYKYEAIFKPASALAKK
jgi:hypothetical protein